MSVLELLGLAPDDGKRPDGVTVLPFERCLPMAWDATITHTCSSSNLHETAVLAGAGAAAAKVRKEAKYSSLADRVQFRDVEIETIGAFGPSAHRLVDEIAGRIESRTGVAGARVILYRHIAAAVQTGNYACIMEAHSRTPSTNSLPR